MKTTSKAPSKAGRAQMPMQKQVASYSLEKPLLHKLLENGLKDLYWVEKALLTVLPRVAAKASSEDLVEAIGRHTEETRRHVQKVEQVFGLIGVKAKTKKCHAMAGIINEGKEIIKESDQGAMRDAGIIASAQKIEHYEIASYGTLRTYATTLGLDHVAEIFQGILDDEKVADAVLSDLAEHINIEAIQNVW
jgi:ferritin-like metal-binding protein YciE